MERAHGRGRHAIAQGMLLACMLLAWCPCAFALDPALDVSQYAHTAWKIREGFFKGTISSIAQTPDGYLWLGTEFGLQRFDGVRPVSWQPPPDQHLPSNNIRSLLAARDGTLWIGTDRGLASWKGGKLIQYGELAGQGILRLLEDREGSVWASGWAFSTGKLCAIHDGSIQCYGDDGGLDRGVIGLYEDRKGNLFVGVPNGLWQWKPGPPKFYPLPGEGDGIQGMAEGDDGTLLLGTRNGIRRLVDGKIEAYPLPGTVQQFSAHRLLRDRDGSLWIGTKSGLVHVHQGRTDVFAQSDGLSGDYVTDLFEDREGNIWVATLNGLDRFREFAVATFSGSQGLSNAFVGSVLADRDGSVWLGTNDGLKRWNRGQVTAYRERAQSQSNTLANVREIVGGGWPDGGVQSLFQDVRGRIWASTVNGVGYLESDRFIPISGVPGGAVHAIAEDSGGNLWINNEKQGLFHLHRGSDVQQIPWARLGHKDVATALVANRLQGGLWLGFYDGGVAHFRDGRVIKSYAAADGLGNGRVNAFYLDPDGTLWAATDGGLSRLKNSRVATLTSKNGLPCDAVHWVMEDDAQSVWLQTTCGLVRIRRTELDTWAATVDKDRDSKRTIQVMVFDSSDGVRSFATAGGYSPHVAKSPDGKLWFRSWDGVSVIDPRHLPFNNLPPPVYIEQITADRKTYDAASGVNGPLPSLTRDLQIEYAALSLVASEKVRFRVKLEGWDADWKDAGNDRKAFYNNLPPRNYRFRVIACNNSGVWNEEGAFLDFSIAPAYYQTTLFRLSCAAAFLLLLAALYQLRLRQVARQFNMRLEERVGERTRIARELHDTLLQSFQGVLLKFSAVRFLLPPGAREAQKTLEKAIDQAEQAIADGRDAVQGLRSPTVPANDLARVISALGEELAGDQTGQDPPAFSVDVEGVPQSLAPLLQDEVHRIAIETLRNAYRHAGARRIEVEIRYGKRQFRLRVRDNGKGFEEKVVDAGGREGHFGLTGMRERAELVGGNLAIWSELHSGTEIELTIPASVAYAKPPTVRRSIFLGKRA